MGPDPRSPTHKAHPYFDCGELDECEEVCVVFFEAGGDGTEVLELVEEPLDPIAVAIKQAAEGGDGPAVGHGLHVGPCALFGQGAPEPVAVVTAVGEQDLSFADAAQHVERAAPVVSLAFAQLQEDRKPVGVDPRVDLRGQPASRAPHASGVRLVPKGGIRFREPPFLMLAAC